MSVEFTAQGYIELWKDDVLISRHRQEREALQSASSQGPGTYRIVYPVVQVVIGSVAEQGGGDTEAPSIPQNLQATVVDKNQIDLSWDASTDNMGVAGYHVFKDGIAEPSTTATTSYSATGLDSSTLYSFTVAAFDAAGNYSGESSSVSATTEANNVPVWSTISDQDVITNQSYTLDLSNFVTDADSADTHTYTIEAGALPTGLALNGSIVSGTPTTAGESSSITFRVDDGEDTADQVVGYASWNPDVTAPPTPENLNSPSQTSSSISLSWDAAVDQQGGANEYVSGTQDYRIYRDSSLRATTSSTSYTDTGLSADTSYSYQVSARDAESNESSLSAAINPTTSGGTVEQDWLDRSTGVGVVWAHDFRSEAEVNNFRWESDAGGNDPGDVGEPYRVYRNPNAGITGGGCLEIWRPAGSSDGPVWWRPMSPLSSPGNGLSQDDPAANGSLTVRSYSPTQGGNEINAHSFGFYGHSDYHSAFPTQFDGTEYWLQMRAQIDPRRVDGTNASGGKFLYFSRTDRTLTDQEIVVNSSKERANENYLDMYRSGGSAGALAADSPGVFVHGNQPGTTIGTVDDGVCRLDDSNGRRANCWFWPKFEWVTIMWHIVPGHHDGNDTLVEVYIAEHGETSFRKIWDQPGVDLPFEAGKPFGHNAIVCSSYQNGGILNIDTSFFHRYDQIIFSTQTIPCPQSYETAPQWFLDLDELEWTDIAGGSGYAGAAWQKGTTLDEIEPVPIPPITGRVDMIAAWNGAAVYQGEYLKVAEGGHASYRSNEVSALNLKAEIPSWERIWGPSPNDQIDGSGSGYNNWQQYLDNTPRTHHGWYTRLVDKNGRIWTLATGDQGGGEWTTDVWSIDRADCIGTYDPTAWTYHGKAWASFIGGAGTFFLYQGNACAYDFLNHRIVIVPEGAVGGNDTCRTFDIDTILAAGEVTTDGVQLAGGTSYTGSVGSGSFNYSASAVVDGRYMVVVTFSKSPGDVHPSQIRILDLDGPTGQAWAVKSNATLVAGLETYVQGGGVFHTERRKFVIGGGAGSPPSTIATISVPNDPYNAAASEFVFETINPTGTLGAVSSLNATSTMFNLVPDMGNGQACVVAHLRDPAQPTQVMKLSKNF